MSFKFRLIFFFRLFFCCFFSFYQSESFFYFSQVNQIVVFLNLYSVLFDEFFYSNHSKIFFVMFSFKTVNSQTLNAILIKLNYQKIRQKIDSFFRRVAYFQLLQRCENVAIREKTSFVPFIDFMMKNASIWTNINLMHFFRDWFSQMHTIYQINKIKTAERKTKFLIKIETNWNEKKKNTKMFFTINWRK